MRRFLTWTLVALVILVVAGVAYIRMAPDDPAVWAVDPEAVEPSGAANEFYMAPVGVAADEAVTTYEMSPEALMDRFHDVAAAQERVEALEQGEVSATYIQRSAVIGFPDYISVKAVPVEGGASLFVYSRSRYGSDDFGVNENRVIDWLSKL